MFVNFRFEEISNWVGPLRRDFARHLPHNDVAVSQGRIRTISSSLASAA
jgi:hypothetical protein